MVLASVQPLMRDGEPVRLMGMTSESWKTEKKKETPQVLVLEKAHSSSAVHL